MNTIRQYVLEVTRNIVSTSTDSGHKHRAKINKEGDGKTISTSGESNDHVHQIVEYRVKPSHGHKHKLIMGTTGYGVHYGRSIPKKKEDDTTNNKDGSGEPTNGTSNGGNGQPDGQPPASNGKGTK